MEVSYTVAETLTSAKTIFFSGEDNMAIAIKPM